MPSPLLSLPPDQPALVRALGRGGKSPGLGPPKLAAWPFVILFSLPAHKECATSQDVSDFEEDFCISSPTQNLRISKQSDFDKVELWIKFTKQDQTN